MSDVDGEDSASPPASPTSHDLVIKRRRNSTGNVSNEGSLNLDFYWEETQRIAQESPGIAAKSGSVGDDDDTKTIGTSEEDSKIMDSLDRQTGYLATPPGSPKTGSDPSTPTTESPPSTPKTVMSPLRPKDSPSMSLFEAVTVVRQVAIISSRVRKKRSMSLKREDTASNIQEEVASPLRISCDCTRHIETTEENDPADPRDTDYLVKISGDDAVDDSKPLPEYRLRYQPTGICYMEDLSSVDCDRVRHLALAEVTSLFDKHNLPVRVSRGPRRKLTATSIESRVLGVPLTTLLERDQERVPGSRCPVFVDNICQFLDDHALREEGILRIPGNSARLKKLREQLDTGYTDGTFNWEGRRTNDAATLLKQFLRELPVPLLTHEYLRAFAAAECIPSRRDQVGALNYLVLLLPDAHRETLRVLLRQMKRITEYEQFNKMGLSNVAMIIAPNLFCQLGKMSRNADNEVQLAAGTSLVVRILINYYRLLFVVPNVLLSQLRDLHDSDFGHTRKSRNFKDIKKVLTNQKKSAPTPPPSRITDMPSPVVGKVSKSNHYVIKILSPEFPRISMILEINNHSRVCEVLTNFRRKQLGLISPSNPRGVDDNSSLNALDLSMTKNNQKELLGAISESSNPIAPPSTNSGMEADHLGVTALGGSGPIHESLANRRHSSPNNALILPEKVGNEDLYECEGNIGSRRLRENALVMEILKENPGTNFYVKKRFPESATLNVGQPTSG